MHGLGIKFKRGWLESRVQGSGFRVQVLGVGGSVVRVVCGDDRHSTGLTVKGEWFRF